MNRLFKRHQKRSVINLDGFWQFQIDPDNQGLIEKWFVNFPQNHQQILVPSCWNTDIDFFDYEGVAWYQTEFETNSEQINLVFHGFYGQIEVYLDGEHIGSQYGGFSGYQCLVTKLKPSKHKLTLRLDNTHNSLNTIPLARVDWFHYGGIFRGVEVMELTKVSIQNHKIAYKLDPTLTNAELKLTIKLINLSKPSKEKLSVYLNEELIIQEEIFIENSTTINLKYVLPHVKLWDTQQPILYLVRFETSTDDISERIGFREITAKQGKLFLNHKELKLKGVNRHDEHPDWGFAVPLHLLKQDVDIIKKLGCNTIRGSHYPNSPLFLDLLDQAGILFWEEIPMWGFPEKALADPLTLERGLAMHESMVKRDYHHPAIILWGLHNEIDTRTEAAYTLTEKFAAKIRSLDTSRPLTYATMHPIDDICLELVDVIGINKYFGWYDGKISDWITFLADFKKKIKQENIAYKPIIISEFGAGAVYGERSFDAAKWTEDFQANYLEYTLNLFLNDPDITGTYIWQYSDIRSAKELELMRPRSFNNKGIVNEYRKPKLGYWKAKELYER